MDPSNYPFPTSTPLMFRTLFANWLERSAALSALPDAPVVPETPGLWRRTKRRLRRLRAAASLQHDNAPSGTGSRRRPLARPDEAARPGRSHDLRWPWAAREDAVPVRPSPCGAPPAGGRQGAQQ